LKTPEEIAEQIIEIDEDLSSFEEDSCGRMSEVIIKAVKLAFSECKKTHCSCWDLTPEKLLKNYEEKKQEGRRELAKELLANISDMKESKDMVVIGRIIFLCHYYVGDLVKKETAKEK
jgi:hypothetical protein